MFMFSIACSNAVPKQSTTPKSKLPSAGEAIFMPSEDKDPNLNKLEDYNPIPLMKNTPSPENGILYSPRHSAECSLDAAAAKRLTTENKIILKLRTKENVLQEQYTHNLEESLKLATKKTWWDNNSGWVYLTTGVIAGVATSILIFSVAVDIKKQGD